MSSVHLLVLIHGMWGHPVHLAELHRIARETYENPSADGIQLEILLAETNSEESTYDGIDWGGERVAQEVRDKIQELEKDGKQVTRFSVTGYSLGGLVARYLVGVLHQQGFFADVTPVNFNTIATPHIGLPRYPSFMSSVFSSLGPKLLSRTGEQFYCADKWSPNGRPLLIVMADPNRIFYQALSLFKHIRIYANAVNDRTVPYCTAAIELNDPFVKHETSGIELEFDVNYNTLVRSYKIPEHPPPSPSKPIILSPTWFRKYKERPSFFPPPLQFRFPLNIALYASLPLLIPVLVSLIIVRFSLATRSSRARIQLLEKEETSQQRLVHILADIEREVEEAVVELVDDQVQEKSGKPKPAHPILSSDQRKIANWLNTLPIQKELAFFNDRFEFHRRGEPVIRHWAESFIL
ncbi:putative serine esterase-domain-containing protein [Cyathus striatus]|nr:putative serine esterase-domain-containing protein [Cyathus striatus]